MKLLHGIVAVLITVFVSTAQAGPREAIVDRDIPIPQLEGQKATSETIRRAIIAGGAKRGWTVTKDAPGRMELTINVRNKHTAVVAVSYTPERYSIKYVSSVNLDHAVEDGVNLIHRNYNRWTNNLASDINVELVRR